MTIKFNVPGKKRKELALTIAKWLGSEVKYQGAPTFAYEVDCFTIDKDGNLCGDNLIADEAVERLLEYLYDEGFESDISATEEPKESKLAISMPANKVALGTILQLLDAKGNLFKKALGVTELPIYNDEVKITFAWFPYTEDPEEVKAYDLFICKLCDFARNAKRVTATEKAVDNEKYAFRCFLLRLGFIGDEYKTARKILLRNLEGSSAFKSGNGKEDA